MTVLLLRGYNNYFNRIKKSEASITDYKTASTSYLEYANVNFDYQDGILTSLVVGNSQQLEQSDHILDFESGDSPDYLIVHDNTTIKSRWFIVECVKVRGGQYKLALKRDVLVDFDEQVMNSPCFVEKGTVKDYNSALLLNPENMSFNQIKQSEKLLRDETYCAWLVGYLKKGISEPKTITFTYPSSVPNATALDSYPWASCVNLYNNDGTYTTATKKAGILAPASSLVKFRTFYKSGGNNGAPTNQNVNLTFNLNKQLVKNDYIARHTDWEGLTSTALDLEKHGSILTPNYISYPEAEKLGNEIFDHTFNWSYVYNYFNTLISATKYTVVSGNNIVESTEDLTIYNGAIVTKNNKVYKLTVGQGSEQIYDTYYTGEDNVSNDYLSSLYYEFKPDWQLYRNQDNPTRHKVKISLAYRQYTITANEISVGETLTFTLPVSANRTQCEDAAYDMFAIPINPEGLNFPNAPHVPVYVSNGRYGTRYINVGTASGDELTIAMQLATAEGAGTDAGWIYDLQLLPYCPLGSDFIRDHVFKAPAVLPYGWDAPSDVRLDISSLTENKDYSWILDNSATPKKRGIVFYPKYSNFNVNIPVTVPDEHIEFEEKRIERPVLTYFSHSDDTGYDGDWPLYTIEFPYGCEDVDYQSISWSEGIQDWIDEEKGQLLNISGGSGYQLVLMFIVFEKGEYNSNTTYDDISWVGDEWIASTQKWIVPDSVLDRKMQNETDFYRLTSPNYNSFYEFKKTKLASNQISGLRAICTYKPHTPYIKINPQLDGSFYSKKDYNDNIGLMLSGDYSLPMISDAMINYELQNRNYQAIFNRGIQSLDVNNKIAREQLDFQGTMGIITGGFAGSAAGLSAGMKTGNPYVAAGMAVAGGIAGNVLPAIGLNKDRDWLERQQYDARDLQVDNFNYQIGNIRALPQSMTKSTPLSYNNKVWPILESFSASDDEKEILKKKLKWDGMTVMAIGTLLDYSQPGGKLKGQMIRLENLNDDSHIASAIYEEVNKGFYEGE